MILITYTTKYRKGGDKFARVARTLAREKRAEFPDLEVRSAAVESKREFADLLQSVANDGSEISELHFIGHSGVYGVMFGTTDWPEQFSPHEWRELSIPFASDGRALFHACRTSRWFAPFFARTFNVPTSGYHWYTSFSRSSDRFRWEGSNGREEDPLYVVSLPGRKSHGLLGSLRKYSGRGRLEPMVEFLPTMEVGGSYDQVADLYDQTFADITVREDEWNWLLEHLPDREGLRLLDIGCGNGALLSALADRIAHGLGVDVSRNMIESARERHGDHENLRFASIDGPEVPAEDGSIDLVVSFLSFRYLDWDPIMAEIRRVLAPGGTILILDMAAAPMRGRDIGAFISSKLRHRRGLRRHPEFHRNLERLVNHPEWKEMLKYNPVRAEHEYRWYLGSRFPEGTIEQLNVGFSHRLLAFDSGPLEPGETPPLSYP